MTGASFNLDDSEVLAALARLNQAVGNPGAIYRNIGEELLQSTQARFRSGTGPDGTPWAPLSPRTLKARRRAGRSTAILVMRGYLSRTIRYKVDGQGVAVGTDRPYGAIHQFGGTIQVPAARRTVTVYGKLDKDDNITRFVTKKRANIAFDHQVDIGEHTITIPARPYLGVSNDDRANSLIIIADHLQGAVPALERVSDAG